MKLRIFTIAAVALLLVGCYPAKILTVSSYEPTPVVTTTVAAPVYTQTYTYAAPYTTVVKSPRAKTVTTTTYAVTAANDISLYLDLQAVGAAFGQSNSIQEFEALLNNYSYIISNLDLNGDGYVDYLRVVETMEGYNHLFIVQAVLGANIYQDVCTLIVEAPSITNYYVQIVGAPYIYGPNYYIRPVYVNRPIMIQHFCKPGYRAWTSPWYWEHYPSHYRHPSPLQLGHYQSYVNTYMHNHHYCNGFEYANECHYKDYSRVASGYQRNDYGQQHPEKSFTYRTADIPTTNGGRATNARGIREAQQAATSTTTTSTSRASRTTPSATTTTTTTTSKNASRSTSSATTTAQPATATSTNTSSRNTSSATTTSGKSSSSTSSSTSSRSGSATTSSSTSSRSSSAANTQSTSSKVRSSGSSSTSIRTTNSSGSTSTVSRSSNNTSSSRSSSSSSSSTRSSSSSSTSRSASSSSTSSSSSTTRSSSSTGSTRSGSTSSSTRSSR